MSAGNKNLTLVNSKCDPPYKVFVSSKYRDNEERRKTVQDAITMDEMVHIPAGKFWMGSPETEKGRYEDEGPRHEVQVPLQKAI